MSVLGLLLAACAADTATPRSQPPALEPVAAPPAMVMAAGVEATPADAIPAPDGGWLLANARLIDGSGDEPRIDVDILIQADRIAKIGTDLEPPAGAKVIDLQGRTLLPGFIDTHVHLTFSPAPSYGDGVRRDVQQTDADRALEGVANARATWQAGVTTVRNVGGTRADRALRDAIAAGKVPGPRMLDANHSIGITGGHCDDTNGFRPDVMPEHQDWRAGVGDGPEEIRKAVRYQIKHGADVIKLCATGGVMSQGDAVGAPQLSLEEMKAAVDEAVRADRRVAAHAHGNLGIREAVQAGVHSIEHGSVLDRRTVGLMKQRGTFLVPTSYVGRHVLEQAERGTISPGSAAKARQIAPQMQESFRLAYRGGVRIALGSDAGVFAHGLNGREFTTMVSLGMKPMDAILAGTAHAAELLGLKNVGRVQEKFLADLVVVQGDPLESIDTLERPAMVIKGGVIHVAPAWEWDG